MKRKKMIALVEAWLESGQSIKAFLGDKEVKPRPLWYPIQVLTAFFYNLDSVLNHFNLAEGHDYQWSDLQYRDSAKTKDMYPSLNDFEMAIGNCSSDQPDYHACLCEHSRYWAERYGDENDLDINCDSYDLRYWYHPDYLGNTEFVTDADGAPFQYFWYSAWGEAIENQHSNQGSFGSRYRFNAKEWDAETGNYYYGARYYDPETGIWLSVDPLAMHPQQMDKSPYAFSWNNPVRYVDPDGRCPECEENVENPEVGETYESSGGRTYQYQNTYDEDGTKTGASWTGLGGKLSEVEVGPGADNSGPQGGGTPDWVINTLGAASATTGYFQAGYLNDANQTFKYAQKINGKVRSASTITRANRISSLSTARSLTRVGGGLTILAAGATVYDGVTGEAGWQNHHTADLVVTGTIYGTSAAFPVVGWIAGGLYFGADLTTQYYTGKSITQNIFDP